MQAGIAAVPDREQIGRPEIEPVIFRLSPDALDGVTGQSEEHPGAGLQQAGAVSDRRGGEGNTAGPITGTDRTAPAAAAVPDRVRQGG